MVIVADHSGFWRCGYPAIIQLPEPAAIPSIVKSHPAPYVDSIIIAVVVSPERPVEAPLPTPVEVPLVSVSQ